METRLGGMHLAKRHMRIGGTTGVPGGLGALFQAGLQAHDLLLVEGLPCGSDLQTMVGVR